MEKCKKEINKASSVDQNLAIEKEKAESNLEKLYTETYRSRMPLYSDYVFHRVFGSDTEESNAALIGLLNIILEREEDPITWVKIKNPIDFGKFMSDKETELDIKAETNTRQIIDIEMQVNNLAFFRNRTTFYAGRLINSSLKAGENYGMMRQSVVISIINGRVFSENVGYHGVFELREKNSGTLLCDRLVMHFLQLSELDMEKPVEEMNRLERLGFYLRHASDVDYKEKIYEICNAEEGIVVAEDLYRKATQEEIEAERAEARFKYELRYNTDMYYSRQEGYEEGEKAGKIETALKMHEKGMSAEVIQEITGLSPEEYVS